MIRVVKPEEPPAVLNGRGLEQTERDCQAFDAEPEAYSNGSKTFKFQSGIYGHASVKQTLLKTQHDKCCFCESKVSHIAYGDVEHFRPKGGFQQNANDPLGRPGYYWLAYDWSNLFFCCAICNQRHKKNLFPLRNPRQRARTHHDDHHREQPLFLDPSADDPERFVGFRDEYAYPIRNSLRGRATIEQLGVNREAIVERRRERLAFLRLLWDLRRSLIALRKRPNLSPPEKAEIKARLQQIENQLAEAGRIPSEYSAMARALVRVQRRR